MTRSRRWMVLSGGAVFVLIVAFLALVSGGFARAQTPAPPAGAVATAQGDEAALGGTLSEIGFAMGGRVVVDAQSDDDIYAAGGNVMVRGAQAEDLFVAGGDIVFTDVSAHDATVAGGQLKFISGEVGDDLVAAGGQLALSPDFAVGGAAILAGGEVRVEAPIGGELRAGGGYVVVDSTVGGDASLAGDRVVIGPKARINGDLTHRAAKIEIDPAAVVTGEVRVLDPKEDAPLRARDVAAGIFLAAIFGMVALLVLAWAASFLLPGLMRDADYMIRTHPWMTLAIGFLIGLAAPAVLMLLAITLVGIPVAVTIAALLVAAVPLAIAGFLNFAGMMIRRILNRNASENPGWGARAGWTAVAVVALLVLGVIPFIGPIAWTAAYVTGLGAIVTQGARSLARGLPVEQRAPVVPRPGL